MPKKRKEQNPQTFLEFWQKIFFRILVEVFGVIGGFIEFPARRSGGWQFEGLPCSGQSGEYRIWHPKTPPNASERTRTSNHLIRSQVLYPIELPMHTLKDLTTFVYFLKRRKLVRWKEL